MQAATGAPRLPSGAPARAGARAPRGVGAAAGERASRALKALGSLGLLALLASCFLLAACAAGSPSQYVPARSGGWPGWLAGPLRGLGLSLGRGGFDALTLCLCAGFALALACARSLRLRTLAACAVASQVIMVLGPPLISQDAFGYLGFARMGALHGLDPYTHVAAEAAGDPVFPFVGWPFKHSPYGPLFTLASYAAAPLGVAGGLWALKAIALLASLSALALVVRAAGALGHSRRVALAFVGLNPVLLELALGGAHNDTLIALLFAAAIALTASRTTHLRAAAGVLVAGIGVKVSAGLVLPFLLLAPRRTRERIATAAAACASLALLALAGVIGFGGHAFGFIGAIGEQQQLVAAHSIPAETARLVGLHGTPTWWRHVFAGVLVAAVAFALWRTARGGDWRVWAGWSLIALLLCTAWLLPWYVIWVLPLAAVSGDRRLRTATLVLCAYAVLIHLPLADPLLSPKG